MNNSHYTCLMFHELVDAIPVNRFSVKFDTFKHYLNIIKEEGIYTLNNKELDVPMKKQAVLLTFDDGDRSNVKGAEMLHEMGMTGVFYIVKDFSLNHTDKYMTEEEIKYIHSLGHVIGVHGKYHNVANHWINLSPKQLINDLIEVKDWLEQLIGEEVNICSAPGGQINENVFRNIEKNLPGLKYIRSSCPIINKYGDTRLGSTGIRFTTTDDDYRLRLIGNANKYLQLRSWYEFKKAVRPVYNLIRKD